MDNMGGNRSNPSERLDFSASQENMPPSNDIPEQKEQAEQYEQIGNGELQGAAENVVQPENPAMNSGEQAMPPMMPASEPEAAQEAVENPSITKLKSMNIPRDAESLPQEYVNEVAKVIDSDKKDPWQLSNDLDIVRWDMMSKAFGRNRGDGLNGKAA